MTRDHNTTRPGPVTTEPQTMSRAQQPSIRSFFQPRRQPEYAAPPSASTSTSTAPPRHDHAHENDAALPVSLPPAAPPLPPPTTAAKPVTIPITLPPNGVPILPSPPSLPSGATIVPLAEQHIAALRRINSLLLPVPYPDSFYANILDPLVSGLFSRAILWQDSDADTPKVVGGLICRLEPNHFLDAQGQPLPQPSPPTRHPKASNIPLDTPYHAIYIQSLTLLSPYRSLGLAAAALEHIIASATLLPAAGSTIDARTIYAHVWTENEEGLRWYEARGFAREGNAPIKGYYFKLRPDTAWVMRRHIGASGTPPRSNTSGTSSSTQPPRPPNGVLAAAINLAPIASPPTSAPPPPSSSSSTSPPAGPPRSSRPPPTPSPAPSATSSSLSFQNSRPESEWNDLPAEMMGPSPQLLVPPASTNTNGTGGGSTPASGASSRSSSTAGGRRRKERAYPSAAFGGQ